MTVCWIVSSSSISKSSWCSWCMRWKAALFPPALTSFSLSLFIWTWIIHNVVLLKAWTHTAQHQHQIKYYSHDCDHSSVAHIKITATVSGCVCLPASGVFSADSDSASLRFLLFPETEMNPTCESMCVSDFHWRVSQHKVFLSYLHQANIKTLAAITVQSVHM